MLWLNPTTLGEYSFYIKGSSVAGQSAYREVMLSVHRDCVLVPQEITLAEAGTFTHAYDKNEGTKTLFTNAQIHSLFVLEWPNQCLLQEFVVLKPDGSEVLQTDALYDRLALGSRTSNVL
jgi:hypothetical protein